MYAIRSYYDVTHTNAILIAAQCPFQLRIAPGLGRFDQQLSHQLWGQPIDIHLAADVLFSSVWVGHQILVAYCQMGSWNGRAATQQ